MGEYGKATDPDFLGAAKRLVEAVRLLVNGAISSNQEQVKDAAMTAEKTISDLADAVESGVISFSIDDVVTRGLLLNAGTDVAKALSNILEFTMDAFGKPPDDPSWDKLYSSVKELVNIVRYLLLFLNLKRKVGKLGWFRITDHK